MALSEYRRSLHFAAPPARLWPVLSDTDLLGEAEGRKPYSAVEELQPDGTVLRRGRGGFGSRNSEWLEDLGEWVAERYLRQRRDFVRGYFRSLDFEAEISPEGSGTRMDFAIRIEADGPVGLLVTYGGIGKRAADAMCRNIERIAAVELSRPDTAIYLPPDLAELGVKLPALGAEAQARLDEACGALQDGGNDAALIRRLVEHLRKAPETALQRLRPLALAQAWDVGAEELVRLCLGAHRQGLLRLRWEVLCPRCRGSSEYLDNLSELPKSRHCETCNIDYDQDFSRNVELTFSPEPWLRPLHDGAFCLMGPASVPHIKLQRHVEAGGTLDVPLALGPGSYRLRTAQAGPESEVDWDGEAGFPALVLHDDRVETGPPAPPGLVRLVNRTGRRLTPVVEALAWRDNALTGDRAIAMPAFRQYCPDQLLRPGDDVAIAGIVLLFTDLKGSTSLYEAIGDTAAYNLVRDHFDYLSERIQRHGGSLVKTIGDAVMAAFPDPAAAVAAALEAQADVGRFNAGREDGGMVLKLGLHQGPCIAVTSGNALDYFGATVNLAARLQGQSVGGDIVLSDAVHDAPGVGDRLKAAAARVSHEVAELRGVAQPVGLWRVELP